ncbi:MAG: DUF72 domain-containing protein [Chloroflexi bacterium]|nr:DUF72 domain-containing protein [Chloroflexota bacterium]
MGKILVGISAWTEPTLIQSGRFYPDWARSAEARLNFYASQFPIVEVDSTFFGMPSENTARLWTTRTPDDFVFNIKAFRLFTSHPTQPRVLPKDIRESLPPQLKEKKTLYYRDLPPEIVNEMFGRFASALLPLDSGGKLGVIVFQFPPWFFPGNEQQEHIAFCQEKLPQYRIAVEFRSASWLNEKNIGRTFDLLRQRDLAYVCVDEPQGFKSSVPPVAEATSDIGIVRFHGRNRDTWEAPTTSAADRFNYLYNENELKEWAPKIKGLASKTGQLHVIFNNCYSDNAVVNARQMRLMLD